MTEIPVQLGGGIEGSVDLIGSGPAPGWLSQDLLAGLVGVEPLSFPPAEFAARVAAVREELTRRDLDGVLVYRPSSVEYLCGFHTINSYPQPLLVTHRDVRLYVLDIEVMRAVVSSVAPSVRYFTTGSVGGVAGETLVSVVADVGEALGTGSKLAVELDDNRVPAAALDLLRAAEGIELEHGRSLVERLRLVLSPAEQAKMERAAAVTQRGVEAASRAAAEAGATDSSLAAAISAAITSDTDSSPAMPVIVASGRRGAVWHSTWRNEPLQEGTTLIEFAGTASRYHTPVMVTLATRQPDATERRLEGHSQDVLAGIVEEARPGRRADEVAAAMAARVGSLEPDVAYHWNFGYAVGLAHRPTWSDGADFSILAGSEGVLRAGMAFHVAASFRSVGRAVVGLSHTIMLEDDGVRVLTGRDPRILVI